MSIENSIAIISTTTVIFFTIGLFLVFAWILTVIDIALSDFKGSSDKVVWILLVLTTGPIGILLYWIFGTSRKINQKYEEYNDRKEIIDESPTARSKGRNENSKWF